MIICAILSNKYYLDGNDVSDLTQGQATHAVMEALW